SSIGTVVGTFIVYTYDSSVYSFTLVSGEGSADNYKFLISDKASNKLVTHSKFDRTLKSNFTIRVRATSNTSFTEKILNISLITEEIIHNDIDISFTNESIYLNCPLCHQTRYTCSNDSKLSNLISI